MNYEVPIKYTFEAAKCIAEPMISLLRGTWLYLYGRLKYMATDPGANGVLFIL